MKLNFFSQKELKEQNRINRHRKELTAQRNHMREIMPYDLMRAA